MYILKTENKVVNLVFNTRKIVKISKLLGGSNFEEVYFKAMSKLDLDALSKIITIFAVDEEGKDSFTGSEEVYDFLDVYKVENKKSYYDIFKEIVEVVNTEGFFNQKMSKKELVEKISNPLSQLNLEELAKPAVEKAITKVAEQQILAEA